MTRHDAYATPELAAAKLLIPELSERILEVEAAKRMPADMASKLASTGMLHMGLPKAYGGTERTLAQILHANEVITAVDGSIGWVTMIYSTMGIISGLMPAQQAKQVYNNRTISCGVTPPNGRGEFVPGGIKVSGRWSWSSGAHNAAWIGAGTLVMEGDKPPQLPTGEPLVHMCFFERSQVTLLDDWDPSGLIGTGSGDFVVKDAFVPQDRWIILGDTSPQVDGPLYRFPFFGALAAAHGAFALGVAQNAVNSLVDLARGKIPTWFRDTLAKNPATQTHLGRAEAQLYAARANLYEIVDEVWDCVARGDEASLEHRRRLRFAGLYVTEVATEIVNKMYLLGGGSSIHRTSPLQRCLRDMHVATQHGMVGESHYRMAGALRLFGERPIAMF